MNNTTPMPPVAVELPRGARRQRTALTPAQLMKVLDAPHDELAVSRLLESPLADLPAGGAL